MRRKERAEAFFDILAETYPDGICSLEYETPLQLLIATQLSAQCTDARVNVVTKDLFKKYPDATSFANAELKELEQDIKSTGFYHNKAKNIIACCQRILSDFGGEIPDNMEDMLSLAGVGRKTANLVLGDIFGKGGMVIDTHAKRILKRVGLTHETEPEKVEKDTENLLSRDKHSDFCHRLVLHGRAYCTARNPKCSICPSSAVCKKVGV
ncbi:MAG: endonuclease III [Ruminococcaceae bacterium]|nr:endonuclease III [Oscillospiraceae bacterium]